MPEQNEYRGKDRRRETQLTEAQIERIAERAAEQAIQKLGVEAGTFQATEAAIKQLAAGFPAGDIEGHRRYHEAVIEWRELRNKLVREALIKVAGAGAIGACGFIALAIWQSMKITIKQ